MSQRQATNQETAAAPNGNVKPELLDQAPPHNLDLERELLQAVMVDEQSAKLALATVEKEDFHDPAYREMFSTLKGQYAKGNGWFTKGALTQLAQDSGLLERLEPIRTPHGGKWSDLLIVMRADIVPPSWVPHHARVLRQLRERRAIRRLALEQLATAYDSLEPKTWCEESAKDIGKLLNRMNRK